MAVLQSDVAITYANQVMGLVQQISNLRPTVAALLAINAQNPLGNLWSVLSTTPLANDGSLGTADAAGTPNAAHPIDTRQYTQLNRAVKASDLANALQVLSEFATFASGADTPSDGARPAFINAVAM